METQNNLSIKQPLPKFSTIKQKTFFESIIQRKLDSLENAPKKTKAKKEKSKFLNTPTTTEPKIGTGVWEKTTRRSFLEKLRIVVTMVGNVEGFERHLVEFDDCALKVFCDINYRLYEKIKDASDKSKRKDVIVLWGDVHKIYRILYDMFGESVYLSKDGIVSFGKDATQVAKDVNETQPEMFSIVNCARKHDSFYKETCKNLGLPIRFDNRGFYRYPIKEHGATFYGHLIPNYTFLVKTYQGVCPMVCVIGVRNDIYLKNKEKYNESA